MADTSSALASLLQVPGLQELLNQSITQQRQQQPLRTAVSQQALNMLPNAAFPNSTPMTSLGRPNLGAIPQANFSTPAPSGLGNNLMAALPLIAALAPLIKAALQKARGGGSGGPASGGSFNLPSRNFGHSLGVVGDPSSGPVGNWLPSWDPFGSAQNNTPWTAPSTTGQEWSPTPSVTTEENFTLPDGTPIGGGGDDTTTDENDWGEG